MCFGESLKFFKSKIENWVKKKFKLVVYICTTNRNLEGKKFVVQFEETKSKLLIGDMNEVAAKAQNNSMIQHRFINQLVLAKNTIFLVTHWIPLHFYWVTNQQLSFVKTWTLVCAECEFDKIRNSIVLALVRVWTAIRLLVIEVYLWWIFPDVHYYLCALFVCQ